MDVRCEKCQTEYELDEARLKPGGVTVKCTNCGHMFKIRKRAGTNPGAAAVTSVGNAPGPGNTAPNPVKEPARPKPVSPRPVTKGEEELGSEERQWLIRLENGDQKQCKELATLQQWIVGGTVTREALISRNGKTWKRIGDIAELSQYFTVADEARNARQGKPTVKPGPQGAGASTMMGMGITAAGGTVLPDDDDDRSTGSFSARKGTTTPPPVPVANRRPTTTPPPPPAKKTMSGDAVLPEGGRATGMWASADISQSKSMASMPSGPAGGKIRVDNDGPAFAGKVRVSPSSDTSFGSGRVTVDDDDDDVLPSERGSKSGALLVIMALLVMGAAAGAIYVFVIKGHSATPQVADKGSGNQPAMTPDAAVVATATDAADVAATIDAAAAPVQTPVDLARDTLGADNETKLRDALKSLDALPADQQAGSDAMKALIITQLAQDTMDRALLGDKAQSDKLKKDAKQMVLDASTPAQKAFKATPDDPGANLAMAAVLRLQGKTQKDIQRYIDTAKAKVTPDWKRDEALGEALVLVAANKLDDAKALLTPIDTGDDKLENTGDVRVRFRLAMIAYAQNKGADAKPLVNSVLATAPDHVGAKALAAKLSSSVVSSDPMPTEEPKNPTETPKNPPNTNAVKPPESTGGGGDSYDALLAKANKLAESNCSKAIESYGKALDQKPNGVEALTGMGYCHIDAKQFASAFSKFRAALAVSSKYEPALWGIAEAYMQQGRKEQALEAVKAYIDVYPGAAKAQKALDRLGGSTTAPTPPENPTPTPVPTPTPPAPEGPTTTPSE